MNGFHKPSDSANKGKNSLPGSDEANAFPAAQSEYSHVEEKNEVLEVEGNFSLYQEKPLPTILQL